MSPHTPTAHEVETFSGNFVDTSDPSPPTIVLEDIAHALSNICRYGGHSNVFYPVAEHAVFCSIRVERKGYGRKTALAALHHDDSEAYLGDIPRPLKPLLGEVYETLSSQMDEAIIEALRLPLSMADLHSGVVKSADNWALLVEAQHLLPSQGVNWAGSALDAWKLYDAPSRIIVPDYWRGAVTPAEAEGLYLSRHWELTR